jgi:starch phosphorylase
VLYPSDDKEQGKRLRLQQQYFITSCSLQDMIRIHLQQKRPLEEFHQKWSVQLNETHPSIGIAELMRLLMDEPGFGWETAWSVTQQTFGYTNHTLLPEALERWQLPLFAEMLPRHLEIIFEINHRFLDEMRREFPNDEDKIRRMSLIGEEGERSVRMANLAVVGSKAVSIFAPSIVPMVRAPFICIFIYPVPEASLPAVEICSDRYAAGQIRVSRDA